MSNSSSSGGYVRFCHPQGVGAYAGDPGLRQPSGSILATPAAFWGCQGFAYWCDLLFLAY